MRAMHFSAVTELRKAINGHNVVLNATYYVSVDKASHGCTALSL